MSICMWTEQNATWVFYYKEITKLERGAFNGDNMPFSIGIQTKWQMKMMLNHGHMSGVALDTTLGTNDQKKMNSLSFTLWSTPSLNICFIVELLAMLQH